ncbi:MAG: hypothetical protein HY842_11110, partial [Bacteroidetes bacterium]|nr:hypothetical protein [Bacteroidota bacterium]
MKKLILSVAFLAGCFVTLLAQAPQSFKYQAVARDANGQIIKNQVVGLRLSILEGGASGTLEYQETHHPVSSDIGVFSVNVGMGTVLSGSMGSIAWGSDEHWLRVEMDASGGSTFQLMGASQLLSVPYALHAETVADNDDADADPANELQTISKTGNTVTLSNGGGSFTDAVDDADASATNELQTISKTGSTVTLSNGGGSFTDAVDDADANPTNELQTISKTGNTVTLSNGGGSFTDAVDDADANPTNELQT